MVPGPCPCRCLRMPPDPRRRGSSPSRRNKSGTAGRCLHRTHGTPGRGPASPGPAHAAGPRRCGTSPSRRKNPARPTASSTATPQRPAADQQARRARRRTPAIAALGHRGGKIQHGRPHPPPQRRNARPRTSKPGAYVSRCLRTPPDPRHRGTSPSRRKGFGPALSPPPSPARVLPCGMRPPCRPPPRTASGPGAGGVPRRPGSRRSGRGVRRRPPVAGRRLRPP